MTHSLAQIQAGSARGAEEGEEERAGSGESEGEAARTAVRDEAALLSVRRLVGRGRIALGVDGEDAAASGAAAGTRTRPPLRISRRSGRPRVVSAPTTGRRTSLRKHGSSSSPCSPSLTPSSATPSAESGIE